MTYPGSGSSNQVFASTVTGPKLKSVSVTRQVFTNTGTYTPSTGMVYCDIIAIGGGGAGGGAPATAATTVSVGGGGGGGEYAQGTFSAATIGVSKAVTIGAAGTANSGATGGNGGATSLGSTLISANGGTGGSASAASAGQANTNGGLGGTGGTGGDLRTPGSPGNWGNSAVTPVIQNPGLGGSTPLGAGGIAIATGATNQGGAGLGYGAGGGGSANYVSQAVALLGGAGAKGVVIVTEYIIN